MKNISELSDNIEKETDFCSSALPVDFIHWWKKKTELEMVQGKIENVAHKILTM